MKRSAASSFSLPPQTRRCPGDPAVEHLSLPEAERVEQLLLGCEPPIERWTRDSGLRGDLREAQLGHALATRVPLRWRQVTADEWRCPPGRDRRPAGVGADGVIPIALQIVVGVSRRLRDVPARSMVIGAPRGTNVTCRDRWKASELSSSASGSPARPRAASSPTGAPTSSRSSHRRAIPGAMFGRMLGCDLGIEPAVRDGQPLQAQRRPRPRHPTQAAPPRSNCSTDADVFLTEHPASRVDNASGWTSNRWLARNPRLVYGLITGYRRDRARRRPRRLRRRGVLVPRRHCASADPTRRHAPVPAGRHGRSPRRA